MWTAVYIYIFEHELPLPLSIIFHIIIFRIPFYVTNCVYAHFNIRKNKNIYPVSWKLLHYLNIVESLIVVSVNLQGSMLENLPSSDVLQGW